MKFLLTSAGISNASIHQALEDLLGKPVAQASALFIPTWFRKGIELYVLSSKRSPECQRR